MVLATIGFLLYHEDRPHRQEGICMTLPKILQRILQWLRRLFKGSTDESYPRPAASGLHATAVGLTFYTVYIPTLDGRFDYLSTADYLPGEIVIIPFGPEDREILGIVEGAQFYPYGKMPLPLWKMKYILDKAPEPIKEEYRRLKKRSLQ